MKMRILMVAVLAALASSVALAASEGGDTSGSNVYWQPPFGGQATISSDVASARTGSNVYWQPPFGGLATIASDVASARTGSNVYWQPPFGGQATIYAGVASTRSAAQAEDRAQPTALRLGEHPAVIVARKGVQTDPTSNFYLHPARLSWSLQRPVFEDRPLLVTATGGEQHTANHP